MRESAQSYRQNALTHTPLHHYQTPSQLSLKKKTSPAWEKSLHNFSLQYPTDASLQQEVATIHAQVTHLSAINLSKTKEIQTLTTTVQYLSTKVQAKNAVPVSNNQTAKRTTQTLPASDATTTTKPTNTSYATVAASSTTRAGFTAVSHKKRREPRSKPTIDATECLNLANHTLREHTKLHTINFYGAYLTGRDNLVFETSLTTRGTDYEPYFPVLKQALGIHMTISRMDGETRWSKFLIHGIPTESTMESLTESIQNNYPELIMAQTPRWLVVDTIKRITKPNGSLKTASSVVITILGNHSLRSLGMKHLSVCNLRCRLDLYQLFGTDTFCGKCSQLGPTTSRCESAPTCGHCGANHLTRDHKCAADQCAGRARCTHMPFYCVNCSNTLHASTDPVCPEHNGTTVEMVEAPL